jgi:hypothetical protein
MSLISFVLPVLAAFVLVGVYVILRAFLRVRGEPSTLALDVADVPPAAPPLTTPAPNTVSRSSAVAAESHESNGLERLPGVALDREGLNTLRRWYAGRECAVCRREIAPLHRGDPRPGLLTTGSSSTIVTWEQIPPGDLQAVLDSHQPVCATCVLAESFRRSFPDRVTDRTDTTARDRAFH